MSEYRFENWNPSSGKAIPDGEVRVIIRGGDIIEGNASGFKWGWLDQKSDIIGFQVIESTDMVNAPPHYQQGSIECIEAIRAALTAEEFRGHCKANAMKYIWRERHKGGDESIRKAIWYLQEMLK